MNNSYLLLIAGGMLIVLILVYLVLFSPLFRKGVYRTVKVPYSTIQRMKHEAKTRRYETAYVFDYDPRSQQPVLRPKEIKRSKGTNSRVRPRIDWNDEIVAHTHPKTDTQDPVLQAYENELRRRPSATDINAFLHDDNDNYLLVTHQGEVVRMRKTQATNPRINLNREERRIQQTVTQGKLTSKSDAINKAKGVNRQFLRSAKTKGVKITKIKTTKKDLHLKERVK